MERMPDFGKFRSGGELSDVRVSINGEIFKLHRFPLYTRSDFFLKEFAKQTATEDQVIMLEKFPGGPEVFTLVADFCYNISIPIAPENVFALMCAARCLEMNGSGNLHEKTGLFIESCVTNVKRGKELEKLLVILSSIPKYGSIETAKVTIDQCVNALAYHWSKCQYGTSGVTEATSPPIITLFLDMDFDFFVGVMKACAEKVQKQQVLNALVSEYIIRLLQPNPDEILANHVSSVSDDKTEEQAEHGSRAKIEFTEENLGKIKILLECIKPDLSSSTHSATRWLKPLLSAYAKVEGSDEVLGGIAASMANQMDHECVSSMSEQTLLHFAEKVTDASTLSDDTKQVLVNHLIVLSEGQELTADGFIKLTNLLSLSSIPVHDPLLTVLGALIKQGITEEQLGKCLSLAHMKKCTIKCLRRLASEGNLPSDQVALAALDVCDSLQERLEATTKVVQEQEKEISSLSMQTFSLSPPQRDSFSPFKPGSSYSFHSSSLPTNGSAPFYREIPKLATSSPRISPARTEKTSLNRSVLNGSWVNGSGVSSNIFENHTKQLTSAFNKPRQPRFK